MRTASGTASASSQYIRSIERPGWRASLKQFEKAAELSGAGRLDEAVAVYLELKAEHPDIPELHFNLGTIYLRQEKWPEAEGAYQKVLELQPDNTQVRVLLADVHKNLGRADEVLAAMEKLVTENPDDPELRYNLDAAIAAFEAKGFKVSMGGSWNFPGTRGR